MPTVTVPVDELRAQGRIRLTASGVDVLVVWVDGAAHAVQDACAHRGLPLRDGVVRGCVITCPAHLRQFDLRTGARRDDPDGEPLRTYVARIVDGPGAGVVEVDVPERVEAPSLRQVLLAHACAGAPEDDVEHRPPGRRG